MCFQNPGLSSLPLSQNDEHFWRLKEILHKDVPKKLTKLFLSAFQAKYSFEWTDNNSTSGKFFLDKVPAPKKKEADEVITSTVRLGNIEEFTDAVLYFCLLDSGTDLLDSEARTKVGTLREQSNALNDASSTGLSEGDFHARLKEIQDVYEVFQWDQARLRVVAHGRLEREDIDSLKKVKFGKIVRGTSC